MTLLLVLAGAAVGAPLRYLTDRAVQMRHDTVFPWGTFTVNIIGSIILGAIAGAVPHNLQYVIGTGFCGALTTYSTFSYETLRLLEQNAKFFALANLLGSIITGLGGAFIGATITQAF